MPKPGKVLTKKPVVVSKKPATKTKDVVSLQAAIHRKSQEAEVLRWVNHIKELFGITTDEMMSETSCLNYIGVKMSLNDRDELLKCLKAFILH